MREKRKKEPKQNGARFIVAIMAEACELSCDSSHSLRRITEQSYLQCWRGSNKSQQNKSSIENWLGRCSTTAQSSLIAICHLLLFFVTVNALLCVSVWTFIVFASNNCSAEPKVIACARNGAHIVRPFPRSTMMVGAMENACVDAHPTRVTPTNGNKLIRTASLL